MIRLTCFCTVAVCLNLTALRELDADSTSPVQRRVTYHKQNPVVSSVKLQGSRYLAFPAILDLGSHVLVSYKRGTAHSRDPGASWESVRINRQTGETTDRRSIAELDDYIMQNGELVRFANGDIANYIDVQVVGSKQKRKVTRIGLHVVRSRDGGKTFGPLQRVGVIDGVEYGYAFEAVTKDTATWMLVMTFANLTGGKSVYAPRPYAGSVNVIRSNDNGKSWHFVRNLSREFGDIPINESTFMSYGEGFLVSTRGYDNHQRVHLTNDSFGKLKQVDLTAEHDFITRYVGRPRLFARDGSVYLLGRNWPPNSPPMQLGLFRLDVDTWKVSSWSVLDNAEGQSVFDGYYAVPYFHQLDGKTLLNVITYKGIRPQLPSIIRLEYNWAEVR